MTKSMKFLPALPAAALMLAASVHAESNVSAIASVDAGYGSNPYLGTASGNDAATLSASLTPTVTLTTPTSETRLFGTVEHVIFTNGLRDITNWSLGSATSITLSPRSSLALNAGYSSRVYTALGTALDTALPPDIVDQPLPDPSATEIAGSRVKRVTGGASFTTALSARDNLSIDGTVANVDYDSLSVSGSDYIVYGGSLGLMHALNEKVSLGASVGYSRADYDQSTFGSFEQISPSANAQIMLAPRLTLSLSAGASFSNVIGVAGIPRRSYFSGRATLCHSGDRSQICGFASRGVGPTTQSGGSTITSAGLNYSYKLTPHSSIRVSGQYSQSKAIYVATATDSAYTSASAGYSRDLGRRLALSISARYTNPYRSTGSRRESFNGTVGLTYRLGR